ncbi:17579_t:CDS:2, partial [Funneliformis geosporum]
ASVNSDSEEVSSEKKIELSSQESSIEQNYVTEISETSCSGKVTSDKSSIDEIS